MLALPCVLYAMDLTVLNLAIPSLTTDLKPTAAKLLWIVDIYGFLAAGALLIMGALGDRIGRRRLLLIGSAAFAVVSLLAAFSKSAAMLIVARGLLGIAGATMAPSTLSLIGNMFQNEREKTFAVSVWVSSFSFGGAIGPVVGGMLIARFWWGAVFLAPVPIMALLLILGPRLLPEHRSEKAGRIDIVSAILTLATVLPIIFAIKHIAEGGDAQLGGLAAAVGLICGGVFVRRQLKLEVPLLDLRLFRLPALSVALSVNALDFLVGFGILVMVAQYLQLVLGLSPVDAGLWGVPAGLGFVVGSLLTSALLRVLRPAYALGSGLMLGAVGLALMAYAIGVHSLILITLGNTLFAVGSAPGTTVVADLVVSSAPKDQSGSASALSETCSEFGGALGIALLGSLVTFIYRQMLAVALPAGVPAPAAETALRGIGAARAAAQTWNDGAALLEAAKHAYTSAAGIALLASAAITVLTAILAVTMFKSRASIEGGVAVDVEPP
ncbi:MFS transporter [Mesorhizobium sp. M0684]|uniref:MFS transporter n=1 Tax=Mesorhizobium sp. M0684 TaxID=2956986 RepID=UPI00333AEDE5